MAEKMPLVDKESLIPEDKDTPPEPEETPDNFPLKYTTTDVAILSCSRLYHGDKMSTRDYFGFLSGFLLHIAAQGLQAMLLYLMLAYNVEGLEDPYEDAQFNRMSTVLTNNIKNGTILGSGLSNTAVDTMLAGYTHAHCKANTSPVGVRFMFLMLWFGISWGAIAETFYRFYVVWCIPKNDADPLMDTNSGISLNSAPTKGNHDITHIAFRWKVFVVIFILLPHTFTLLFLIVTGTKIQAFAPTILQQAKASLKLGIITTVTSTLMTYFGCAHLHKYMGVDPENKEHPVAVNYRIVHPVTSKPSMFSRLTGGKAWKTWAETVVKLVFGLIFGFVIVHLLYVNKNDFDNLCATYYEKVVGCSNIAATGRTAVQKKICPQIPVRDWFPGSGD